MELPGWSMKHVFIYALYVSLVVMLLSFNTIFERVRGEIAETVPPMTRFERTEETRVQRSPPLRFDINHPINGTRFRILYNAVPKTGSRNLEFLIRKLSPKCLGRVKCGYFPQEIADNSEQIDRYIRSLGEAAFIRGHFPFLHMDNSDFPVMYINIIRDPIERLVSNYYYDLFGDSARPMSRSSETGHHASTLDDCLEDEVCFSKVYSYYKQVTLRTFCGHDVRCSKYTRWTLNRAKNNSRQYLFIGLTNQMEASLSILELLLPDLLAGLKVKMKAETERVAATTQYRTVKKIPLREETLRFLERDMSLEREFYAFVSEGFEDAKKSLLANS